MHNVFRHRKIQKDEDARLAASQLHYGRPDEKVSTAYVLKTVGKETRESKANDASARFSDWFLREASGSTRVDTACAGHFHHKFRERDRLKEVGDHEFGVCYETERQRIDRAVEEHDNALLKREAWVPNQSAPLAPAPAHSPPTASALRAREFTDAERIGRAIESSAFDMHAGTPWRQQPRVPQYRPPQPPGVPTLPVWSVGLGDSGSAWGPPMGRLDDFDTPSRASLNATAQTVLSSRTRFEFDPKVDGPTRLDFSLVQKMSQRSTSSGAPRRKSYYNSLRGAAAGLPFSSVASVAGDNEMRRATVTILGNAGR